MIECQCTFPFKEAQQPPAPQKLKPVLVIFKEDF